MSLLTTLRTTFTRHHLLLARLGWLSICLFVLSLLISNLPFQVAEVRAAWQVGEAWPFARSLFNSMEAFARWLVFWRLAAGMVFLATAVLLVWHKWGDAVVLLFSADLLLLGTFYSLHFDIDRIRFPHWLTTLFPSINGLTVLLMAAAMLSLFYLFPDGRFQPRRYRWLAWLVVANALAWTVLFSFNGISQWFDAQSPVLQESDEELGWTLFIGSLVAALLIGLLGQVHRYRQVATAEQRQQTKWVLLGLLSFLFVPLGLSFIFDLFNLAQTPLFHFITLTIEPFAIVLIPLTIAISVLRYRLWEADVWINRTLVYGGLTALIVTAYVLVVGILSRAFASRDSNLVAFLALLLVMLLIVPLYHWLQGRISRWLPTASDYPAAPSPSPTLAPSLPLRLAQLGWVTLLIILLAQVLPLFANWTALVRTTQHEWVVTSGYVLMSRWVSVAGYATYLLLLDLTVSLVFVGLAGFIFWKRRHDWLALYVATTLLLSSFGIGTSSTPVIEGLGIVGILMLILLFFIFPNGRFIPHSWRNRTLLLVGLVATPFLLLPLVRSVLSEQGELESVGYVTTMLTLGVIMSAGVGSQISRYRHEADPVRRQQTKWVLYGFGLQLVWIGWFAVGLLSWGWFGLEEPLFAIVAIHLVMVMPLAFALMLAFSILRYRLWGIDVIMQRTAVYGTLTALVVLVYVMLVGGLGELLRGDSVWLAVITTGLVALAIQPLRQRLQTAVNRLMYGERNDPITVLTKLGKQLEETAVPTDTLPTLVKTIAQTLKLPYVAIVEAGEQGSRGAGEIITAYPSPLPSPPSLIALPLIYQSETIGQLLVSPRAPEETFNPAEMRLLQNVARQAGTAVYAAQLTHDLQRSRERLVTTREEERRRIHRDLHDGLGPQLATLNLKVDAARNYLAQDTETADRLLIDLKNDIQQAISDIRRLVHDLRPPALDQLGLLSALREHIARQNGSLQITLHAPDNLPLLPAAVEVAAYRIALEAITNCLRHAHAQNCHIHLHLTDGLHLKIYDDGVGLPADYQDGIGLSSMRERATELGGTFEIETAVNEGTIIKVQLPIGL